MSKYQYSVGFALIYKFYVLIILLVDVVVAVVELENWFKLGGDEEDEVFTNDTESKNYRHVLVYLYYKLFYWLFVFKVKWFPFLNNLDKVVCAIVQNFFLQSDMMNIAADRGPR